LYGEKLVKTSKTSPTKASKKTLSITFTLLIWSGIVLAFLGAVVAIIGAGGATAFDGKFGNIEVKTTSVGLAILVVGSLLAGTIALRLPKDVRVLNRTRQTIQEKIAEKAIFLLGISILGCILLLVSFLHK
jgi:hypothetical protein